jgi:hypothetical protein
MRQKRRTPARVHEISAGIRAGTFLASPIGRRDDATIDVRAASGTGGQAAGIANLVAAAVIIGFVLGEPAASWPVVIGSFAVWAGVIVFALVIAGDKP